MKKIIALAIVLLLTAAGCNQSTSNTPSPAAATPKPTVQEKEETRELTQYTAKQALGRLEIQLKRQDQAPIAKLWNAIPERSAVYQNRETQELSWVVGGWVFYFQNTSGATYEARINCWGEIKLTKKTDDMSKMYPGPIKLEEFVVDNLEAHKIVLDQGGESLIRNQGGWLMTINVTGRGIRPVWAGGSWIMANPEYTPAVDAQTGEIYRLTGDRVKGEPLSGATAAPKEWSGGFDEKSIEALVGRSENQHWWPHCYQDVEMMSYVFNRKLLKEELQKVEAKPDRSAASWMTSGVLNAALGNWGKSISDLNKGLELDPSNQACRDCRGFISLIVRDLDTAESDMKPQAAGKSPVEPTEMTSVLRGKSDSGGIVASMHTIHTEVGFIPLQLNIGPQLFKSFRQKLEAGGA
ncbi:MAG: hypothetical protein WC768_00870 [Patescibacteria group bacterium]|jgi:hypothetical protein